MADDELLTPRNPQFLLPAFDCPQPSCTATAQMTWYSLSGTRQRANSINNVFEPEEPKAFTLWAAVCAVCGQASVWQSYSGGIGRRGHQLWPAAVFDAMPPHSDMPEAVRAIYMEATEVAPISSRAAAGLLRLSLEALLKIHYPGNDRLKLDALIGLAVKNGLPQHIHQMMDYVRCTGNDAVHELHLDDDAEDAEALFALVNNVVDHLIGQPKRAQDLFGTLSEGKRQAIVKRNAKATTPDAGA